MNGTCAHQARKLHLACVRRYSQYGRNSPEGYVVDVVSTWTGQLASTLRVAWRLTIEDFADKLGISVRTISKWEADQAFVRSLMARPVLDPRQMAGWIAAPKQGIKGRPIDFEYVRRSEA